MSELKNLPHVALGVYPTPLYTLENISAKYGRNIWVKPVSYTHLTLPTKSVV